jgi:hypothetical protein
LRARVYAEVEFGLLAVVNGETLEEQRAEARARATTDSVEDEEALESSALVSQLANAVESEVDQFLANSVVTTGVVVRSVFLPRDELLRVEKLAVRASSHFIDDSRLEIDEDCTGDVFTSTGLREESVERVITATDGLIRRHLTIRLDSVLQSEEFPACIADLNTSLPTVD